MKPTKQQMDLAAIIGEWCFWMRLRTQYALRCGVFAPDALENMAPAGVEEKKGGGP